MCVILTKYTLVTINNLLIRITLSIIGLYRVFFCEDIKSSKMVKFIVHEETNIKKMKHSYFDKVVVALCKQRDNYHNI